MLRGLAGVVVALLVAVSITFGTGCDPCPSCATTTTHRKTPTLTPTSTTTSTQIVSPTATPTPTISPSPTPTATQTPTPTATLTATATATATASRTATATATSTSTATATAPQTPTATATLTATATATATATSTATPTSTPTCAPLPPTTTAALFVADSANQRVLEYLPPFSNGMSAAIVFGQPDFTSSGQNVTQNGMGNPETTAFDSAGDMWAGDFFFGRAIEFVPPFSNGMDASVVLGQTDFTTNGGSSGILASQSNMNNVVGVAIDQGCNVWAGDFSNNRILKFAPPFSDGQDASLVIGQTNFTNTAAATTSTGLNLPQFFAFDASGDLWVADYANNRVLEYPAPLSTGEAATLVIGQTNFTNNGSGTTASTLAAPFGVAFDASGDLWVADSVNNRALEYLPPFGTGMSASVAVGQPDLTSANSVTTQNGLASASDVAFDSNGNLYVADPNNNRVLIFFPIAGGGPKFVSGMDASVVIGQQNFTTSTAATSATGLMGPLGVTISPTSGLAP